ncbi:MULTISPECIES: hypothetical protein [unclassified Caulobacter]|jgi:hypothetical protein|uniref:hypothetical protein n=1 Tax=unclassified Caulobacter TaxID=2648921 RepID=UPI0010F5F63A|nr:MULTISPECIES: hypothetical protein [unclassified Caulobacter]MBQ1559793.1 hypothetical protein [Caulobacter sp.]
MSSTTLKAKSKVPGRVLGARTFAAITAVEGLRLGTASRKRLQALKAGGLTPAERREEVLRAYMDLTKRK